MYNLRVADIDFKLEYEYPTMLKQAADYIVKEGTEGYKPLFGILLNKSALRGFFSIPPLL